MCGISGIIYKDISARNDRSFKDAANLSKHRGPDYTGYYSNEKVELIHHRLSILDLDERSHQPFTGHANDDHVLVYNGEIYNYRDLAKQHNLTLSTTSDTEVLFKLLCSGFDLNELNGIFAFGFLDLKNNTLNITRDRLGIKPLYYYDTDGYFIFSSEAKVIYSFMDRMKINYTALSEYMNYGHTVSDQTLIEGVKKLSPGTDLSVNLSTYEISHEQYWSIEKNILHDQIKPTYENALVQTRSLLERAVERQCISDVQVGAYLSGGIDSSAVVALASRYTDKTLNTYSVNFDKNPKSELKLASMVAKKYQTNHHEFEVNTDNIDEYLSDLIFQYDDPFADPAMIPLHLIAEKASEFSRVVLQGDGGDEIFAGYGRHLDLQQYHFRKYTFLIMKNIHPDNRKKKVFSKRYEALNHDEYSKVMANLVQSDIEEEYKDVFSDNIINMIYGQNRFYQYELRDNKFRELPLMQRMLYTDMEIILPNKFLEKVDKVNMYHSIEARVPLLDNELIDYVMKLPQNMKIKKSTTKYLFRDVIKDLVPDQILNAQKTSFGTPIAEWLRTTLYNYTIDQFEKGEKENLPLNFPLLKMYLKNHKRDLDSTKSGLLWRTLVLTIWMSKYKSKLEY